MTEYHGWDEIDRAMDAGKLKHLDQVWVTDSEGVEVHGIYDEDVPIIRWIDLVGDQGRYLELLDLINSEGSTEDQTVNQSTEVNDKGGRQSALPGRYDLVPTSALHEISKTLREGAEKYGVDNWRLIPVEDHVNHALQHLYGYLELKRINGIEDLFSHDELTEELAHAACRALFALAVLQDGELDSREDLPK